MGAHLQEGEKGWRLSSVANGQHFNQLCLGYEAFTKPQKNGFRELLG